MLVLFDIDGTLLLTHGEGMRAMEDAGRELCRPDFTIAGADFSGRLDPLIWRQLCDLNGIAPSEDRSRASAAAPNGAGPAADDLDQRFRRAYERHLRRRLDAGARVTRLPGVNELLSAISADARCTMGLVTGNFPETGRLKIERAGIDFSLFTVFGWGCDGAHRRDLPAVALRDFFSRTARQISQREVVVIGDTPHDIDCAQYNGCRSIGVATGAFSADELRQHGADLVVDDLSDTDDLARWMWQI